MSDHILSVIIGAISGSVVAGIGAFIAPWVNWGIEKRRDRMNRQRDLIDKTRRGFSGVAALRREVLRQAPAYVAIHSHLSADLVNKIEQTRIAGGEQEIQEQILQEVSALEKKWKLV